MRLIIFAISIISFHKVSLYDRNSRSTNFINTSFSISDSSFNAYSDSFKIIDTFDIYGKLVVYNLKNFNKIDYEQLSSNFYNSNKKHLISYSVFLDTSSTIEKIKSLTLNDDYLFVDHYDFQVLNYAHKAFYCLNLPIEQRSKNCEKFYKGISINLDLRKEVIVNNKDTPLYINKNIEIYKFQHRLYLVEMSIFNFTTTCVGIGVNNNHVKNGMIQFVTPYCKYKIK